jgi:hypothetical protein
MDMGQHRTEAEAASQGCDESENDNDYGYPVIAVIRLHSGVLLSIRLFSNGISLTDLTPHPTASELSLEQFYNKRPKGFKGIFFIVRTK